MRKRKNFNINIAAPVFGKQEWFALKEPLANGWVTQGARVAEFEDAFKDYTQAGFAVATTSCTTAMHIALIACGVGEGDEVIVPSFTWISTANVVEYVGARPVFCDIDRETYNIDASKAKRLITRRTKAIIPVHLFGLCADMDKLIKISCSYGLRVIEDAACAAGSSYKGKKAGNFGDIGCFSFHPRKIITTGEGGMCVTSNIKLAKKLMVLRNHGASLEGARLQKDKEAHFFNNFNILGYNYRMTDLQGAVGVIQLKKLDSFIKQRKYWANWYIKQLRGVSWLKTPFIPSDCGHTFQSFVCYVDNKKSPLSRNRLMELLQLKGIATRPGTHAVHMLDYYVKKYGLKPDDLPVSRDAYKCTLAIPLHNKMKENDYKYVVRVLKEIG